MVLLSHSALSEWPSILGIGLLPFLSHPSIMSITKSWQYYLLVFFLLASLRSQMVKNLPAVQETQVQSLGWEDPLEKEMETHSSILAWEIPWTEEPGGLQSTGSQRVRHNLVTKPHVPLSFLHLLHPSSCCLHVDCQTLLSSHPFYDVAVSFSLP